MGPGRLLLGGLALVYLLAYLRGTALLVVLAAVSVAMLWRLRRSGSPAAVGAWTGWDASSGPGPDSRATAVLDPAAAWPAATTVVQGVPEPLAAGQLGGFAALVELRDRAGRQAMLQLEAAHPAEVDLERLVRQALTQAAGRSGWQVQRWQPVTDDVFAPAGWDETGGWGH